MKKVFVARMFLVVLLIVGVLYLLYRGQPVATSDKVNVPITISENAEVRQPPEGWREYRNNTYHFSLFYPETLSVKEFDEGGGASAIVFQNLEEGKGFQIFIVPFSGNQITDERFRKDVPSGLKKELKDITVDSAMGASFYSVNTILGETAEVWFIKNGFLYEVTAPRALDQWLSEIMRYWRFI